MLALFELWLLVSLVWRLYLLVRCIIELGLAFNLSICLFLDNYCLFVCFLLNTAVVGANLWDQSCLTAVTETHTINIYFFTTPCSFIISVFAVDRSLSLILLSITFIFVMSFTTAYSDSLLLRSIFLSSIEYFRLG